MIENLIRRARFRVALNESLGQLAFAMAVCAGGFVLLLIAGTRYLEWWTLGVLAAAGIATGIYRVSRSIPDAYQTAVRIDRNAALDDALSTAVYFSRDDVPAANAPLPAVRDAQKKQAENLAASVQLERAIPFVIPRTLYAMAALLVVASALIALRYGYWHRLDLRAPLTQIFFEDQAVHDAKKDKPAYPAGQKQWMQEAQSLLSKLGVKQDANQPTPGDEDALTKAIEEAMKNPDSPNAQSDPGAGGSTGKDGQKAGQSSNNAQTGDPLENDDQQAKDDQQGAEGANPKSGDPNSKSNSAKNGSSNTRESLLSRLKDAVSNMLSKQDKQQQDSNSQKNAQNAKNDPQNGTKGQSGKGAQQQGQTQSDAQEGEPDNDSQNGQQAQGKLNSPSNNTPSQGGSGIGSQDGSKELRAAEQLKAMGKISEIIGQRAATVTGETSVEVQSGAQKLKTDYSSTSAAHGETDSDVTRDEIPLAVQAYVQQYFAEVRKSAPAKKK